MIQFKLNVFFWIFLAHLSMLRLIKKIAHKIEAVQDFEYLRDILLSVECKLLQF